MISTCAGREERSSDVRSTEGKNRHCIRHHQSPTNPLPRLGNQRVRLRVGASCPRSLRQSGRWPHHHHHRPLLLHHPQRGHHRCHLEWLDHGDRLSWRPHPKRRWTLHFPRLPPTNWEVIRGLISRNFLNRNNLNQPRSPQYQHPQSISGQSLEFCQLNRTKPAHQRNSL